jgi:hypothetical protein
MTAAPHASPGRRIVVTAALSALLLVLGVLALREYGAGAALFLFALGAVGLVDLVQVVRREQRRRSRP